MVGGELSQIFKAIFLGWLLSFGKKKMQFLTAKSNAKDLEFIVQLVEEGNIFPIIESRYTLQKTADAIDYISQGHARAKIIVNII